MKIYINDSCIGCTTCVRYHPDYFEIFENKALPKGHITTKEDQECVEDAADFCPVNAIIIEND